MLCVWVLVNSFRERLKNELVLAKVIDLKERIHSLRNYSLGALLGALRSATRAIPYTYYVDRLFLDGIRFARKSEIRTFSRFC
ncbi:MAG: hypothetical protein ACI8Z5_001429 [Lentimonas sp.]|jgi:hypothetical protein